MLGAVPLLLAAVALIRAWRANARARLVSAEVWHRHGLREGPILLTGVATPLDPGYEGPLLVVAIRQAGWPGDDRRGKYTTWREVDRRVETRRFVLRTDGGDEVLVEPGPAVELQGLLGPGRDLGHGERERVARVAAGDVVWVRGVAAREMEAGPYRDAASARWVLRPVDGTLLVSAEPIDSDQRRLARRHRDFAASCLFLLLVCQGTFLRSYQRLHHGGTETRATILSRHAWTTSGRRPRTHVSVEVRWMDGDRAYANRLMCDDCGPVHREGETVPITYAVSIVAVDVQLGRRADVTVPEFFALAGLFTMVSMWLAYRRGLRPSEWWRAPWIEIER